MDILIWNKSKTDYSPIGLFSRMIINITSFTQTDVQFCCNWSCSNIPNSVFVSSKGHIFKYRILHGLLGLQKVYFSKVEVVGFSCT